MQPYLCIGCIAQNDNHSPPPHFFFILQPVSCLGASLLQHQGNSVKDLDMRLICSLLEELRKPKDAVTGRRLLLLLYAL